MFFKPNNIEPIHNQLVQYLKRQMLSLTYPLGSKLPTVRDWSEVLKVNPNTLQKALLVLEDDGLIVTKSTIGKFVTDDQTKIDQIKDCEINRLVDQFIENAKLLNIEVKTLIERINEHEE